MITSNVIHRVFQIQFGKGTATAFTIEHSGREYLITAKHVIEEIPQLGEIEVYRNASWSSIPVELVGHSDDDLDVSVLATDQRLTPAGLPLAATMNGLVYGQDAYFLGFPYGFQGSLRVGDGGYPLPYVKRATVSLFDQSRLILDGHNNPGFSGGPIVWRSADNFELRVAAVITDYTAVDEKVFKKGKETPFTFKYNTGLIGSTSIAIVVGLIEANPIGCV